jgi:lipopolysaccharide heptosyltransferase II
MDYLVYLCTRAVSAFIAFLPLTWVYRLGQGLGAIAYWLLPPYRQLALANLRIAFGTEKTDAAIRRLARRHFRQLGANLLSSVKAAAISVPELRRITEVEGVEHLREALDRGQGVVMVLSHIGNWELFAQLCQLLPGYQWSTIYQPLRNRYIEAHLRRLRTRCGVALFSRKNGFSGPTAFLRAGGAVGVLVDQHAGDGGLWAPFFGRLASTSNLASLLALRTGAELIPLAVYAVGIARWRVVISPPVDPKLTGNTGSQAGALTALLNQIVEKQIRRAPADWFWVHNRWKTPRPKFLLAGYRRGGALPPDFSPEQLKPFRILIRSTNWLGDAVMTIPAVQAIGAGRPDAELTVLAPEKLADLWRAVPGVAHVLPIPAGAGVLRVGRLVRRAGPFDAAVVLPNSLRSALETWLAGVPRRAGYAGHRRRWLLDQIIGEPPALKAAPEPGGRQRPPHQSRRYMHLATEMGAVEEPADQAPAPAGAASRGQMARIGICPGAEYGPAKRWPPDRFAEAANLVSAQVAGEWALFGTNRDAQAGAAIAKALTANCENLIGKTTLAELIAQLRLCDVLLTNDTGTMHLAAWLGVPVVAIFGSTDPHLTGPLGAPERLRILRRQVVCNPCFLAQCPLDLRCMKAISAQEAAEAVLGLLGPPAKA